MSTNSYTGHFGLTGAARARISQLLAIAETDRVTVESDLYHEFNLTMEEAARLAESRRGGHRPPRRRRRHA